MTELLMRLFIKDEGNAADQQVRGKYGNLSSFVGMACNFLLFGLKLLLGFVSGSIAVTADAFNNLSDIGSNVVTFLGFKLASQPPDEDHPFGHGRFEYISGLIIAVFVLLVGVEIVKSAVGKIITPEEIQFSWYVVVGLVASIGLKFWMASFYNKIGDKIDSTTMSAAAADSRSDCISTAATTAGILIFGLFSINIDGYLGLLVGLLILWAGFKIANETISPLLGLAPNPQVVAQVKDILNSYEVCIGIHDLVLHDYGPSRLMGSVHMEIAASEDMLHAHDQIDNAERDVRQKLGIAFVIHMDPVEVDCQRTEHFKIIIGDILTSINPALSFHDFRMVVGNTHTNLIFDVVIPMEFKMKNTDVKNIVDSALRATGEALFTVITFDRSYL